MKTPTEVLKMLKSKIDAAGLNKCNYAIETSDIEAINEALLSDDLTSAEHYHQEQGANQLSDAKIEQAAMKYAKRKNSSFGDAVRIVRISASIYDFTAGARFAEKEMKDIACKFLEQATSDGWVQEVQANNWKNVLDSKISALVRMSTQQLFDKYLAERSGE